MNGTEQQHVVAERPRRRTSGGAGTGAVPDEREQVIAMLCDLVEPLGQALPLATEVVLHDLSRLPDSIVAVHGNVTGRRVGDPATDLLLERAASGNLEHMVNYRTRLPDGRSMRSTTMVIRDSRGGPVAALCINSDLSTWQSLEQIAGAMTGSRVPDTAGPPQVLLDDGSVREPDAEDGDQSVEVFARDVDELAAHLIHQAIVQQGVPVDLMKKEHKLTVVRSLQARGMFLLRDAVEMIASSLLVTRFTIYNYLNEIADEKHAESADPTESRPAKRRSPRT
jgi:predicted transcriptional regulator YheO